MSIGGLRQTPLGIDSRPLAARLDRATTATVPTRQSTQTLPADGFERAANLLPFGGTRAAEVATAHQAQARFAAQFANAAADPRQFHHLMQQVYGKGYDRSAAEALREKALAGDFSWLPRIEFQSAATLQGGLGAYDGERNVVYLSDRFVGDPAGAAQVYSEEVGHALDRKLNRADTPGDEGEMFRRLLAGEKLGAAERAAIQAENDHGVITVDGKQVAVEFWNPFKAVGKAIEGAAKAVGNAVGGAAKAVWSGIETAAEGAWGVVKGVGEKIGDAAKWVGTRVWDAGRGLLTGAWDTLRGAVLNIGEGLGTFFGGWLKIAQGNFLEGLADLAKGAGKIFLQTPADAVLMMGGRAVSAVQTVTGLEAPGRELTADEIQALRMVYGDSIDYSQVRIKEGDTGVFGASGRPFTHGNTIYIPKSWLDKHPEPGERRSLLIHEMAHVWQNQNGGTDYMTEALGGQFFGDGYNFGKALAEGKRFEDMNPEQQAELLEKAWESGFLTSQTADRRFLVRVTDPESDHGFEVQMVPASDPRYAQLVAAGFGDYTGVVSGALDQVRRGEGAP